MPRKCNVEKQLALDVLERFYEHFQSCDKNDWPAYTSNIYKEMSKATEGKWTAHNWYIAVKEDRRNILSEVREKLGVKFNNVSDVHYSDSEEENVDSDVDINYLFKGNNDKKKLDELNLILSKEEWDEIKPIKVDGQRTKNRLKPNVWASVISTAFWKQHRLPCSYVYKRAEVYTSGSRQYFLKIEGHCVGKKCKNPFIGYADNDPIDGELLMRIFTRNTSCEDHEQVSRPLKGKYRKELGKSAASEGCSNLRKKMARENMRAGDTIPPFIPPLHVLRCAKKEFVDEELGIEKKSRDARDLMRNIEGMSLKPPFLGCILETGSMPFRVIYCTPMQFDVYKKYIRTTKNSSEICIDATGSVVEKIKRDGMLSAHIFLYSIVVNFEKTSLSVFQMLTESQTMETIQYWLHVWKRHKIPSPKTIVSDYSRALLTACSRTFNDIPLKNYIENCFERATSQENTEHLEPKVYLRVDVSHLIKLVCRWRCFQSVQQRAVRNFFVRCVALMVDCQSTEQFETIFLDTCVMALQPFRDSTLKLNDKMITVDEVRKRLEILIKKRPFLQKNDEGFINANLFQIEENLKNGKKENKVADDDEDTDVQNSFGKIGIFITKIVSIAAQEPVDSGEDLNAFYLPDFIHNHMLKLAKEFPLWTAATLPFYANHATSAPVEQTFQDLKNRVLAQFGRVIDAEKFLKVHLKDLLGGTNILSSHLLNFAMKHDHFPIPQPKKHIHATNKNLSENDDKTLKDDSLENDLIARHNTYEQNNFWKNDSLSKQVINEQSNNFDKNEISKEQNCCEVSDHNIFEEHNYSHNSSVILFSNQEKNDLCSQSPLKKNLDDSDYYSIENWGGKAGKSTIITCISPNDGNIPQSTVHLKKNSQPLKCPAISQDSQILKFQAVSQSSSTYFQNYPEIDLVNERIVQHNPNKNIVRKCESFNFLKNGCLLGPVTLNGETVFCRNTCGFDSISQILRAATIDDPNCAKIILESSFSCAMSKFIHTFSSSSCTMQEMYRERAAILLPLYSSSKHNFQTNKRSLSYSFSAVDSVFAMWKKLFPSMPSLVRKTTCDFCNNSMEYYQHSIIPYQKLLKFQKIETLPEAIHFQTRVNVTCPRCQKICHVEIIPGKLIFIELDIRRCAQQYTGETFKLAEFPATLQFDVPYKLAGVIAYRPGHFTGYAKRLNGWQLYDDIRDKAERASENVILEPHAAIYYRSA